MHQKLETYRRALIFGTHILWVDGTGERINFFPQGSRRVLFLVYNKNRKWNYISGTGADRKAI